MNDAPELAERKNPRPRRATAIWRFLGVAVTSIALLLAAAIPAAAAELMRVTFVRHGESAGNASGLIDTSTPGPVLTPLGQQQAQDVVGTLGDNNYDSVYASTMVRTQLTAAPMSQYLRLPIQVLPGLQEIEAGVFEGTPESEAANGYAKFPLAWAFQGMRDLRIPGSINGHEFDARMDGALQTIYDNGDRNAVVFSHGGAIMFWTMMNAQNLTIEQKINLLRTAALGNTDYVVVEGNNEDGWTLVNWNGQQFGPEPTLAAELQLQIRTLTRQLTATANQVAAAFSTRNIATILSAINRGVADAAFSIAKFGRTVNAKLIGALDSAVSPPASSDVTDAPSDAHTMAAAVAPAPDTAVASARAASPEAASGADEETPAARRDADLMPVDAEDEDEAPEPTAPDAGTDEEEESDDTLASDDAADENDGDKTPEGTRETEPALDSSPGDASDDDASEGQDDAADSDSDSQHSDAA